MSSNQQKVGKLSFKKANKQTTPVYKYKLSLSIDKKNDKCTQESITLEKKIIRC